MKKQVIHSRIEFPIGDTPSDVIFKEYRDMFDSEYNDEGVTVGGVTVAINLTAKTAVVLTFSEEADNFLRLKFYGRKDVKFNGYIKPIAKETEHEV